jgi:hypothetical protein
VVLPEIPQVERPQQLGDLTRPIPHVVEVGAGVEHLVLALCQLSGACLGDRQHAYQVVEEPGIGMAVRVFHSEVV